MPKRIDSLTETQKAQMKPWAEKWIEIGLRTGKTDWARFEQGARASYRFAKLAEPKVVVHVKSPPVLALAAPIAGWLLDNRPWEGAKNMRGIRQGKIVRGAVGGAVDRAVGVAVDGAVRGAVDRAVRAAVDRAVDGAVGGYVRSGWSWLIGGQFWVGYGWWGSWGSPSFVSFFQDVCGLELPGDMDERACAYQATAESACWWWPHREFVMVCARPRSIHRDDRGRLHNEHGAAIDWPDGWGVYAIHGVRVPRELVDDPAWLTVQRIRDERNAEVRRVMLDRFGKDLYLKASGAKQIHKDDWGTLWRTDFSAGEEPLVVVEVVNSTPEPDGSFKNYWLGVPPTTTKALDAVAWTFGKTPEEYKRLVAQT